MSWGHPARDKVTMFLGDIGLIILLAVAGWLINPTRTGGDIQNLASLLMPLPAFLAAFYVFDLYSLSAFNGLGTFVRVVIATGTATLFCSAFFYFIQWQNFSYRPLELCALFLPCAIYSWRRAYVHTSHRFRSPERLAVIGSANDAGILSLSIGLSNSRYFLVGMLHAEPNGEAAFVKQRKTSGLLAEPGMAASSAHQSSSYSTATAVAMARQPKSLASDVGTVPAKSEIVPDLGPATSDNLFRLLAEYQLNALVVRSEALTSDLAGVLTRLRFEGIRVYSLLEFYMQVSEELPLELLSEYWLCVADGFELLQARLFRRVKRLIDVLLAGVGLLLALPFILVVAVAIRIDSEGPVFFSQRRVGWMGHPFELLKFRSMRNGAENDGGPQWAAANDSRTTAVGRILRKTHFDEVPQMINILRGEMSFVGPRPERPEFVKLLNESITFYHLRHYVLPGITGWAQVNYPYGASLEDARRKLQYDLYYVRNASTLLDLRTLLRTARVVLFREGSR
jgi:lipopolysaccharide/colanic/teichoic acid biosynthesis glycosyltransferase